MIAATLAGLSIVGNGAGGSAAPGQISSVPLTNAEGVTTIPYGGVVYPFASGSVKIAKKNGTLAESAAQYICVSAGGVVAGAVGRFVSIGRITGLTMTGGAAQTPGYLDNAGGITATVPATPGEYLVQLGDMEAVTIFNFRPQIAIPL